MILLLMLLGLIAFIDVRRMLRRKQKRELVVFCCLFAVTLILTCLQVSGVVIPSPMIALGDFFKNVLKLSY